MKLFKKILAVALSLILLFNCSSYKKIKAINPDSTITAVGAIVTIGGMVINAVKFLIDGGERIIKVVSNEYDIKKYNEETKKYEGFRPMLEATRMIKEIAAGTSSIKIYGQELAKEQCLDALAGCIENIYAEIAGKKKIYRKTRKCTVYHR